MTEKNPLNINIPEIEEEILRFWEKNQIFKKSLFLEKERPNFIFYEGPPTANGKPGLHHILARSFKDVILRFWTMNGRRVLRRAGWDTHGLPVELEVEKKLGISGKNQIEHLKNNIDDSIIYFNDVCKKSVWEYKKEWEKLTLRMAFWLDLERPYITYQTDYIEQVWQIIKKIWNKKLLYKGHKVVPYCPRCGTPLSSHEVAQGYKEVTEPSVYVLFPKKDDSKTFFLSWTTTPWTLPGNVALAVSPEVDYVKIKLADKHLILAKSRLSVIDQNYKLVDQFKGSEIVNQSYQPLFNILPEDRENQKYIVLPADFVSTEEGTGIVHTAVMYGEEDYQLGERYHLPKFHTVDEAGCFKDCVYGYAGRYVKEAETDITAELQRRGLIYKIENYTHTYPFCWRCDTPLLYYARDSWYIAMSKLRDQLVSENSKINWIPAHVKDGRFGEFIKEVKDWALSRERYWGTPLPIWSCPDCQRQICLGSLTEIAERGGDLKLLGQKPDPHRPFIDKIRLNCPCGSQMIREPYVIDCWFDAGAMPFASGEFSQGRYPADFISEAVDQTRGWFYTLLAIGVLMDQGSPYKNVIMTGHINDEQGRKMSKSRGNIVDPWSIANKTGIDSLRLYFYSINQAGENKNFSFSDLQMIMRKSVLLLWNIYSFWSTYSKLDNYHFNPHRTKSKHILDQWLVNRFNELNEKISQCMKEYDVFTASRLHLDFIDELSTWYLRCSRERRNEDFYHTLHLVLIDYCTILAPFAPFISEKIYLELRSDNSPESVHLKSWPKIKKVDQSILSLMKEARLVIEKCHTMRSSNNIKLRQPLSKMTVNNKFKDKEEILEILKREANVEAIDFHSDEKVILDLEITPELYQKGLARELFRQIQNQRKQLSLKPGQPASLEVQEGPSGLTRRLISTIKKDLTEKSSIIEISYQTRPLEGADVIKWSEGKEVISFRVLPK